MKNKILLLAVLALVIFKVDARTPRVKNMSFTYQTIKLPEMALPSERTYSMFLETSADYGNLALRYQDALQIPGWNKAANGEYAVEVKFFPVDYHQPFIINRCEYITDTAGRVIDSIFFFKNVYKARGFGSLSILNNANQTIYGNNLNEVCLETTGREFKSRRAARHHRFRETNRLQQQMAQDFAQSMTTQVNRRLDILLGTYVITKRNTLMIVRNRKHKEYQLMNSFFHRFQLVSDQVNASSDLQEIESKLFSEIAYLKNIENKYRGSSKADRKIRYMAYRNLSEIYEMLEIPQKAIFYAQKIRSNDFRKFNAANVLADAKRMERLQRIHQP